MTPRTPPSERHFHPLPRDFAQNGVQSTDPSILRPKDVRWTEEGLDALSVQFPPIPTRHAMNDIPTRGDGNRGLSRGTERGVNKKWNGVERSGFGRDGRWGVEMGV